MNAHFRDTNLCNHCGIFVMQKQFDNYESKSIWQVLCQVVNVVEHQSIHIRERSIYIEEIPNRDSQII